MNIIFMLIFGLAEFTRITENLAKLGLNAQTAHLTLWRPTSAIWAQ